VILERRPHLDSAQRTRVESAPESMDPCKIKKALGLGVTLLLVALIAMTLLTVLLGSSGAIRYGLPLALLFTLFLVLHRTR